MQILKTLIISTLLLMPTVVVGQTTMDLQYERSKEHPFGRPNPKVEEGLKAFAPMIGSCDCKSLARNADQSWADTTAVVWEFSYIMNGTSIQDVTWLNNDSYTTSIRQYNADSAAWYVTFFSSGPINPSPSTWVGGQDGDEVILYNKQKAPNGMDGQYRITFFDISKEGYNWKGEWMSEDGSIVYPTWKLWCRQRKTKL